MKKTIATKLPNSVKRHTRMSRCTVLYYNILFCTLLYVPSTRIFLSLSTRSLYTSSVTSECWKELENEEAVTVSEGPLNVAGTVGTAAVTVIIMIMIIIF